MKNPLLIDNNILGDFYPYSKEIIKKDGTDKREFDVFVSEKLSEIKKKHSECDCIVLPFSLDEIRYADYTGIIVALHIRLTPELGKFSRLPIIFIGPDAEHINQVARISKYGGFLFTPFVFWANVRNGEGLNNYLENISSLTYGNEVMTDEMYKTLLSSIKVETSEKYGSRHSIANEWCRCRWMNAIGKSYENEIRDQLYFKYCEQLGRFHQGGETNLNPVKTKVENDKGLVMLIDDEADKWKPFFDEIFQYNDPNHFVSVGSEFNDYPNKKSRNKHIIDAINKYNPDVVLLDLRLHDDDFENIDKKELSGNIILDEIKNEINKGIQVIAFSASNKDNSYREFPYDDVVIKESPEEIVSGIKTRKSIEELIEKIRKCLSKAGFLKQVIKELDEVYDIVVDHYKHQIYSEVFKKYFEDNKDIAIDFLSRREENVVYSCYAYLQLFLILEKFLAERSVFRDSYDKVSTSLFVLLPNGERKEVASIMKTDEKTEYIKQIKYNKKNGLSFYTKQENNDQSFPLTDYRMSSVIIFAYGHESTEASLWSQIVNNRNNKADAHAQKGKDRAELEDKDFINIIDFMKYILDRSNCIDSFHNISIDTINIPTPRYKEAEVVLCSRLKQARLIENGRVYDIECNDRLKMGDIVLVDVEMSGGNIKKLIYKKRKE